MTSTAIVGTVDVARGDPKPPVGTARQRPPGRDSAMSRPRWQDEARLTLVVAGAVTMTFAPAAAMVVERLSWAFTGFVASVAAGWLGSTALQITTLRLTRRLLTAPLAWPWQLLATALVGIAIQIPITSAMPFSTELGFDTGDGWKTAIGPWTSVLIACYLVWEREARSRHALAARRLFDVQQAQLALHRGIVEAQLRALQARVDPGFFFATLDAIETFYRRDAARAEQLFDEMVTFLRAALPQLDATSSTLARELDLAKSTVRIHALVAGRGPGLHVDVEDELMRVPFPAGVLLPLLRDALGTLATDSAPPDGALRIRAFRAGDAPARMLHVHIDAPGDVSAATCEAVSYSLHALFGDAASVHARGAGAAAVEVSIPHEA